MATAATILTNVKTQLIDEGNVHWSEAELLRWLSDAQRAVISAAPTAATPTTASPTLVAGTKQTLPADAYVLVDIYRNVSGRAVSRIARNVLDTQNPNWPTTTATAAVTAYTYDLSDPTTFHVYPPNTGSGAVVMNYVKMPAQLTASSDTLSVRDVLFPALTDYVMYRAHLKESDFAGGATLAQLYQTSFAAHIEALKGGLQ